MCDGVSEFNWVLSVGAVPSWRECMVGVDHWRVEGEMSANNVLVTTVNRRNGMCGRINTMFPPAQDKLG